MKVGEQASVIFTPNIFSTTTKVGFEEPVLTRRDSNNQSMVKK